MSCFDITFGSLKLVGLFTPWKTGKYYQSGNTFFPREPVVKNLAAYHCHLTKASLVNQLYLGGFLPILCLGGDIGSCVVYHSSVWPHYPCPSGPLLSWHPSQPRHQDSASLTRLSKFWPLPASSWNTLRQRHWPLTLWKLAKLTGPGDKDRRRQEEVSVGVWYMCGEGWS